VARCLLAFAGCRSSPDNHTGTDTAPTNRYSHVRHSLGRTGRRSCAADRSAGIIAAGQGSLHRAGGRRHAWCFSVLAPELAVRRPDPMRDTQQIIARFGASIPTGWATPNPQLENGGVAEARAISDSLLIAVTQWPRRGSNPHTACAIRDFKSRASAYSATRPCTCYVRVCVVFREPSRRRYSAASAAGAHDDRCFGLDD
jgi:hypothetical protein